MKDLPEFFVAATAGRVGGDIAVEFGIEPSYQVGLKQVFDNHPAVPLDHGQVGFRVDVRPHGRECDLAHMPSLAIATIGIPLFTGSFQPPSYLRTLTTLPPLAWRSAWGETRTKAVSDPPPVYTASFCMTRGSIRKVAANPNDGVPPHG